MGRTRGTVGTAGIVLVTMLVWPAVLRAQDSVQAAQTLYAAASYDEALAVLDRLQSNGIPAAEARQVQENRALCLLALGRIDDANAAIAMVVTADPSYRPDEATASPRVRAAYKDVRSRLLPGIIEARYRDARSQYDKEQWADAMAGFKQVGELAADPAIDPAEAPGVQEFRVLAADFAALAESAIAKAAAPAPAPEPPPAPAAAPAPPARPPVDYTRVFDGSDAGVEPPVIRRQDLPRWIEDGRPRPRDGMLEVVISAAGVIERATLTQAMSPFFDRQVLEATKNWKYDPARLDGHAVRYRKTIRVSFQ